MQWEKDFRLSLGSENLPENPVNAQNRENKDWKQVWKDAVCTKQEWKGENQQVSVKFVRLHDFDFIQRF